jgi:hypothetical protein
MRERDEEGARKTYRETFLHGIVAHGGFKGSLVFLVETLHGEGAEVGFLFEGCPLQCPGELDVVVLWQFIVGNVSPLAKFSGAHGSHAQLKGDADLWIGSICELTPPFDVPEVLCVGEGALSVLHVLVRERSGGGERRGEDVERVGVEEVSIIIIIFSLGRARRVREK